MTEQTVAIEFISALGQPPVQYIKLARTLGVGHVGMGVMPLTANPYGFQSWNLLNDAQLRRDTKRALADNGVAISISDGFINFPHGWLSDPDRALDLMAELGSPLVNIVNLDDEADRALDRIAAVVEAAHMRGMKAVFEFLADRPFGTVQAAAAMVSSVSEDFKVVVDLLHVVRSGGLASDLAQIDPTAIGYIQVCDGTLAREANYADAAANQRMVVGEGEFPILEMLNALPGLNLLGIEVPLRNKAEAGISLYDMLRPSIDATRALMAQRHG